MITLLWLFCHFHINEQLYASIWNNILVKVSDQVSFFSVLASAIWTFILFEVN